MKKLEAVVLVLVALCAGPALAGEGSWQQVATINTTSATIEWLPQADAAGFVLTVSAPDGTVTRREYKAREIPSFSVFDEQGQVRADGVYQFELRVVPRIDKATRQQLRAAREAGDEAAVVSELQKAGRIPTGALVQSGAFAIAGGSFVSGEATEPRPEGSGRQTKAAGDANQFSSKVQVINMDLIVQGSLCVGVDCTSGESFGFDTIRLKENNLRIKFEDTSVGTFPSTDWQLTANDSASGGQNRFSIEDITSARVPFTIEGGTTTNAVYLDSTGRVGFRTSTPVLDIHINTSNTPGIRLEQNSSGGFSAYNWDVAGNETNFFIRDVNAGSKLPFRIFPGAPTDSVHIHGDGNVGLGTISPSAPLHVLRSDGTSQLLVEETNGTATLRNLMTLRNNGGVQLLLDRTDGQNDWQISNFGTSMAISVPFSATNQMTLTAGGNMTITGTLTQGSSRAWKENITSIEPKAVLARVSDLPVSAWSYKTDSGVRHFGPMAEDFHEAFGLGEDAQHIAPGDAAGIALAAVQGLNQIVAEKDAAIAQLQKQNDELSTRLAAIEQLLKSQQK